jgi:hypothetical protein
MFLTDIMGMMSEVLPYIKEGKQLNTIVGTSQVSPSLNKIARELSLAYKLALRQQDQSGMINKTKYANLRDKYAEFMNILMEATMPGLNESLSQDKEKGESRKYSFSKDGRIRMFTEEDPDLTPVQIEREAEEEAKQEEKEANKIDSLSREEQSQREYSRSEDGRIKLF